MDAEDFSNLYKIIFNRAKVAMYESKEKLSQERQKLIAEGSFGKVEYIDKLLEDIETLGEEHETFEAEVLKAVKISKLVLENSYEEYIGDEQTIDLNFIKNSMTQFYIHPIKNKMSKSEEDATKLYKEIMQTTLDRFSQDDILGKFDEFGLYFQCFDQASVDIAISKGLTEADFRALILEHGSD